MWRATLSNGDVVEYNGNVGQWRSRVLDIAKKHDLHLTSFQWNDEEIDPRGETCFIVSEVFGTANRGVVRARVGLGTFRPNGKGRIQWKTILGNAESGDHTEVVRPCDAERYKELAVKRKLENAEAAQ